MSENEPTATDDQNRATSPEPFSKEHLKVRGEALAAKVKELLHEGNVRRIVVKNDQGQTIMEIPVTAGVVAIVVAPVVAGVAAIAALASKWEIEIYRADDHPGSR